MKPRIFFSRAAKRDFRRVSDRAIRQRLAAAVEALAEEPQPADSRKLAGFDSIWRIRVGDFRICYTWERDQLVILILTVARRGDVYERLQRRLG